MGASDLLVTLQASRSADAAVMWRTMNVLAKAFDEAISSAPSPTTYDKKWQSTCLAAVMATIERLTDPSGPSSLPALAPAPTPKGAPAALQAKKTELPWNTVAKGKGKAPSPDSGRADSAPSSSRAPSPTSPPPTYVNVVGQTTAQSPPATTPAPKAKPPPKDERIFLRATPGDPIRELSPSECRLLVIQKLKLANTDVRSVFRTAGGWGFLFTTTARTKVLDAKVPNMLFEASTKWYLYVVGRVPRTVMILGGLSLTKHMLDDEAERSTGKRPVRISRSRFSAEADPFQTWIISFTEPVKAPFTIFDLGRARPIVDTVRVVQCNVCLAHHGPRPYLAKAKCLVYAKPAHPPVKEG